MTLKPRIKVLFIRLDHALLIDGPCVHVVVSHVVIVSEFSLKFGVSLLNSEGSGFVREAGGKASYMYIGIDLVCY